MFWKPAITGCGANLISVPSRRSPNTAWNTPPSSTMAKNAEQRRRHVRHRLSEWTSE